MLPVEYALPIACDLTAIGSPEQQARHQALSERLFSSALEVQELPDGYAFRFPAEYYTMVTAFIANERLCCPFFTFTLEVTPERGPLWMRLTGRDGVKAFLGAELANSPD
ncbi:MAG: hypothetical protein ACRDIB_18305 [Ardenticatenaceae bacterium]